MFKPFEVFYEKKFPKEENPESLEEASKQWNILGSKKKLKFIKKAEKKYDKKIKEDPNLPPFHTYLSINELELLLKSYGLPDKVPTNSKYFHVKNKQDEALKNMEDESNINEVLKDAKIEAENEWKEFSDEKKNKILDEVHQKAQEYEEKFFDFARNLSENRVVDYKEFAKRKLEPVPKSRKESTPKKESDKLWKKFIPFEIFFEKNRDNFDMNDKLKARNEARSKFKELSDKKRLKYIKKAEANFDEFSKDAVLGNSLLSSYLNKNELKILLESYGMPESIPNSFSAYYYRIKTRQGSISMKEVFNSLKQLPASEKEKFQKEHAQEFKEFLLKKKIFLDNLPLSRLEDYNSKSKSNKKQNGTVSSPNKKFKKDTPLENSEEILSADTDA